MLFSSYQFLIFLPIVVIVYFIIPHRIRHIWLLLASYYFYMCWNAKYALILLAITVVTYFAGILIAKSRTKRTKKLLVFISIILSLIVLFFFKYFNFLVETLGRLFNHDTSSLTLNLILPVGISFYTFQAIGYVVDIYRKDISPEKNFLKYALFISFFPQLVAGPIERSKNLLHQISEKHSFSFNRMKDGVLLILWGFFQKIVIADRLGIVADQIFNNYTAYGGFYFVVATISFAFQIYCDFSGYSLIAIGIAKVMGFQLMENFNAPYFASSISCFWRRWHISLYSWFRDYLYIPLGGSRKGKIRTYINILIIFLASGLWHGASWHFVFWGGLNGMLIISEQIINSLQRNKKSHDSHFIIISKMLLIFIIINLTWVFFRADSVNSAFHMLGSIFTTWNPEIITNGDLLDLGLSQPSLIVGLFAILILLTSDFLKYHGKSVRTIIYRKPIWLRWTFYLLAIFSIIVFGLWGPSYNSTSFIYFQF